MAAETAAVPPAWLDEHFAEASLRGGGQSAGCRVRSVRVQRATAAGDNYLSDVYRLTAQLEQGAPLSLIVKCAPAAELMRKVVRDMEAFEQETRMFRETIPAMSQILEAAAPGKYTQLSAKCFASGAHPVSYLVLEDLKARGFALAKRREGLDLAHATLVVRKLAEFHAASVKLRERDPAMLDPYQCFKMVHGATAPQMQSFLKQGCTLLADQLDTLDESYSKFAPKIRALSESLFSSISELTLRKGRLRVLAHVDTWVNNIMFSYCDGAVRDAVLLDFQISACASPSIDLQYFTHTSLTEQVYAKHLTDLLKEYHGHLIEVMDDIGVSVDQQITFDELLEDFEAHALYGLFAAVAVLPLVRTQEETRFDVEASLSESDSAANRNTFASPQYMEAIKQMLPEFEKRGVL